MSKIIDNELYFPLGSASLTTPQKFNAIFDAVNNNSLGKHNYIPPTKIGVSTNFLFFEAANNVSPMVITMADVTPLPTGWTATYDPAVVAGTGWTVMNDGSTVNNGTVGYVATNDDTDTVTLTLDGTTGNVDDGNHVQVRLNVRYSHAEYGNIDRVAYAGMPFAKRGLAGEDAIQAPQAMIYCNAPHQNAFFPDGYITWEAKSKSLAPPTTGIASYAWTLEKIDSNGGVLSTHNTWIYSDAAHTTADATTANAYVETEYGYTNCRFRLTLEITETTTGNTDTTSVDLFSYHHGTFFYSWDASTVQAPAECNISTENMDSTGFFLPDPKGAVKVSWGKDWDDIATGGTVCTASGTAFPAVIQGILDTALPGAVAADYSILRSQDLGTGGDVINKYFWIHPMSNSAKIIKKLTSAEMQAGIDATSESDFQESLGNPGNAVTTDHYYLLQGDAPSAVYNTDSGIAIGPDAEKYYVYLTEWSANGQNYLGDRDQSAVVVSKGSEGNSATAAMTNHTFTNVHNGGFYKAEVVANKMGSYSSKVSSAVQGFSGGDPHAINTVEVSTTGSSAITLNISLTANGTVPVGYLISYKEVAVTSTEGSSGNNFADFNSDQNEWTVMYTNSRSPKLVGNIGKKLIGEVKSVSSNGLMSSPVAFPATSIIVDSALDQTGLSKHLGTRDVIVDAANTNLDDSYPSDPAGQKQENVFTTVFGRDVYIEQLNVWVHKAEDVAGSGNNNAPAFQVQIQVQDQDDHKEVTIDPATDLDVLKTDPNLSVPVPAGKQVVICLCDTANPVAATAILQGGYELSCELFYAHAASSGGGGTGDGTN